MDPIQITILAITGLNLLVTAVLQIRMYVNCGKGRTCMLFSEKDGNEDTKELVREGAMAALVNTMQQQASSDTLDDTTEDEDGTDPDCENDTLES